MPSPAVLALWLTAACTPPDPPGPGPLMGDDAAWRRTFGSPKMDEGWGIDLYDGDLFVSTHMANPTLTDGWVYRMTTDGEIVWETTWGEEYTEEFFAVEVYDGVVHLGAARFTKPLDLWDTEAMLLRFDAESGALLGEPWRYDDAGIWNEIDGIVVDEENIYVSGWGGSDDGDMLLARLDREGNQENVNSWGTAAWEEANGHMVKVGDLLYVAGREGAEGVLKGGDAALVAFEAPYLHHQWMVSWGEGDTMEDVYSLTTDGEALYAVGVQEQDDGLAIWSWDLEGALRWVTTWDGGGTERSRTIVVDPVDGSLLVAANAGDSSRDLDLVMLRVDATSGEITDEHRWETDGDEEFHDLVLDGDGGYLVGQTTTWGAGSHDALVVKFGMRPWRFPEG
jgi:hypothetical protein